MWSLKSTVVPETGEFSRRLQTTRRTSPKSAKTITQKRNTRTLIHPISDVKKDSIRSMSDEPYSSLPTISDVKKDSIRSMSEEPYSSLTIEQLNTRLKVNKDTLQKTIKNTLESRRLAREHYDSIDDMNYLNKIEKMYLRSQAIKLNQEMNALWNTLLDSRRNTISELEKQISIKTSASGTRKRRRNKNKKKH